MMAAEGAETRQPGYAIRYAVAWAATSRFMPKRLGWWILNRPLFGSSAEVDQ